MANLGELLAELRHDRGLKQEELADILHLSKSTISSYERGQQLPPLDKLVCLADFFHVTTQCINVINKLNDDGLKNVILRPGIV